MKQITIGRSPENDVVINDPSVSRQHATIIQTEQEIIVSDNGSSNGTFINGNRINDEAILQKNDILKFGTVLFPWKNHFNVEKKPIETIPNYLTEPIQPTSTLHEPKPTSNTTHQPSPLIPTPRKKSKGLLIGVIATVIVVFIVLNIVNSNSTSYYSNDNAYPTILDTDYKYDNRGVMDKTLIGYVTVKNESNNAGLVEVIGICEQEGKTFKRTKTVYLNPGETTTVDFEFREIKRRQYEPNFTADANAVIE